MQDYPPLCDVKGSYTAQFEHVCSFRHRNADLRLTPFPDHFAPPERQGGDQPGRRLLDIVYGFPDIKTKINIATPALKRKVKKTLPSQSAHPSRRDPTWARFRLFLFLSSIRFWLLTTFLRIMADVADPSQARLRAPAAKGANPANGTAAGAAQIPPPESVVDDHFFWTYTEEPHRSRRKAILKAHPEVCDDRVNVPGPDQRGQCLAIAYWLVFPSSLIQCSCVLCQVTKLCGPEPLTKWVVLLVVSIQFLCAYLLRNTPILDWKFLATAYVIGATANQNLFLAIHEISHNLAFKSPFANRLLAIFANLPIGLPYSAAFRVSLVGQSWAMDYRAFEAIHPRNHETVPGTERRGLTADMCIHSPTISPTTSRSA